MAQNKIEINKNCEIAEYVVIRDQNHKYDLSDTPVKCMGYDTAPIVIKNNVWIGAKSTILKGVVIEKNSVVGAMSLVNKNVPKSTVVFGVPINIKRDKKTRY